MNDVVFVEEIQKEMAVAFGKETATQLFGFISDILRPPAKELGGLLADKVRWYRFRTQVEIMLSAKEHIDKLGLKTQKIPVKLLANLLDKCSWEEDENMKARWASLLVNFATERKKSGPNISFTNILSQLSPVEAKFVDLMYDEIQWPARRASRRTPSYQTTSGLAKLINLTIEEAYIICDNLIRLNLIQAKLAFKPEERDISFSKIQPAYDTVTLTYLGNEFVEKCRVPFSEIHARAIEKILIKSIDNIAKNVNKESFATFAEDAKKIYPHLTDQDLKGAIYGALNKFIWKDGIIKDFKGYTIDEAEMKNIVKYSIDLIKNNNSPQKG